MLVSPLLLFTGTAYIQSQSCVADVLADTGQLLSAAWTVHNGGSGDIAAVADAEPEAVRYHLFQPHSTLGHNLILVQCGEECHFFGTLRITVDEGVIPDLSHGSHRPSVQILVAGPAVSHCFLLRTEENGAEAMMYFPDPQVLMLRNGYGLSTSVLEQVMAFVIAMRETICVSGGQFGFAVIEKSEFHIISSCFYDLGAANLI
jgi:hypothetical protein